MTECTKLKVVAVLLFAALPITGCESILEATFDTAMAVDRIGSYTHEDVLVAEERPEAIGERLVTTVRVKGELKGVARDRDARALGEIVVRGGEWGYSMDERRSAIDVLVRACEQIQRDLGPGEDGGISEATRELVRITMGAVDRSRDDALRGHLSDRLDELELGPVRAAFETEVPNRFFFGW